MMTIVYETQSVVRGDNFNKLGRNRESINILSIGRYIQSDRTVCRDTRKSYYTLYLYNQRGFICVHTYYL